jgi:hypothetical protein
MNGNPWKKVVVGSFVLGTAGILTCVSALLSDLVPTWSLLLFLAALIPLGFVILGILAGFVWLLDRCEEYFNEKKNRLLDYGKRKLDKEIQSKTQIIDKVIYGPGNMASCNVHPGLGGVRFAAGLHTGL